MNARTTPHSRLSTQRALTSCVYAAALAVLGCTAGWLEPATSNKAAEATAVAGKQDTELADHDAHLARIRAGDCFGLGARIGTRGACLVIIACGIDRAQESYYDPQTKALVAEYLYDPMSDIEAWTTGYTDCAAEPFVGGEYILCGGP